MESAPWQPDDLVWIDQVGIVDIRVGCLQTLQADASDLADAIEGVASGDHPHFAFILSKTLASLYGHRSTGLRNGCRSGSACRHKRLSGDDRMCFREESGWNYAEGNDGRKKAGGERRKSGCGR
jgi:hypothetical protein